MDVTERRRAADALRAIKRGGEGWYSLSDAVMGRPAPRDEVVSRLADLIDPGEDVSVSAYDLLPEEDREILWWVHSFDGGLDAVSARYREADYRRIELCSTLGIDTETGWSDAMVQMLDRLMPEGMGWPRFEDGEPVRIGDDFEDLGQVAGIKFGAGGVTIEGTAGNSDLFITSDERVKRPAPAVLAADGEPLEAGQTAYLNRDSGSMKKGTRLLVVSVSSRSVEATTGANAGAQTHSFRPADLTHTKPEPPDSWERVEEESQLYRCEYFDHMGGSCHDCPGGPSGSCRANMMIDIVRRCKALAERGE